MSTTAKWVSGGFGGTPRLLVLVAYGFLLFVLQMVVVVPTFGSTSVILWSLLLFLSLISVSLFPLGGGIAFAIMAVAAVVTVPDIQMLVFSLLGTYAVVADWIARRWYFGAAAVLAVTLVPQLLVSTNLPPEIVEVGVGTLGAVGLGIGILVSSRKVARLESEAAMSREDARRTREVLRRDMAASLHDTVARDLAGIIITAEGLLSLELDPRSREKLTRIDSSARESLGAVRHLINEFSSSSQQTISSVVHVCSALLRDNGLQFHAEVPAAIDDEITSRQRVLLALAIREGTTNALKYAATSTAVQLIVEVLARGTVTLTIANRVSIDANGAALSGGFGLGHLRSRIEENSGLLHVGPIDDRWLLVASIPAVPERGN